MKSNMRGKLKILEAMMKMSLLEMRPKGSCGTEIALFDSRVAAIKCIKYFSSELQEKNPSEVRVRVSYADPSKGSLSLNNYNSGENKKRYNESRVINKSEISRRMNEWSAIRGKLAYVYIIIPSENAHLINDSPTSHHHHQRISLNWTLGVKLNTLRTWFKHIQT